MKEFNKEAYSDDHNFHCTQCGDTVYIELTYPNLDSKKVKYVQFDQESVRASDGIRLSYDYERDGYIIEQQSIFEWDIDDEVCDPDWKEVSFIKAWGRETS